MYTSKNIIGVGSANYHHVADEDGIASKPSDVEPVFFHSMPPKFGDELAHCYPSKRIIHLTAADGWLGLAAIMNRTVCCLVCFSKCHADGLREFLVHEVFRQFQNKDCKRYDPSLAAAIEEEEKRKSTAGTVNNKPPTKDHGNDDNTGKKKKEQKKDEETSPKKTGKKRRASLKSKTGKKKKSDMVSSQESDDETWQTPTDDEEE